jgi:hypothetical protein
VICASNESQQPIDAAPIANRRLQNQQPWSSWRLAAIRHWRSKKAAVVGASKFFDSSVSSGSQYQLQSGKPVPGLDGKEPRFAREYSAAVPFIQGQRRRYCAAKKYFELVGLPH